MPVNFVDLKEGVGIGLSKASETFTVVIFQRLLQTCNLGHLRDYLSLVLTSSFVVVKTSHSSLLALYGEPMTPRLCVVAEAV